MIEISASESAELIKYLSQFSSHLFFFLSIIISLLLFIIMMIATDHRKQD